MKRLGRAGIALPTAMFGIVAVGVLTAGVWVIVDLDSKASMNRERAARGLLVAEAGLTHALAVLRTSLKDTSWTRLLRGSDGQALTSDDGQMIGYALATDIQIPAAGKSILGGKYEVKFLDDPQENDATALDSVTDANSRILARCTGVTYDSASVTLDAVIGFQPYPAIATEGTLKIGGSAMVKGSCGGLHANEIIEVAGQQVKVDGPVSASETVEAGTCQIKHVDGTCNTPLNNQPPVDIPELTMAEMCTNPNRYELKANGSIDRYLAGILIETRDATGSEQWGWRQTSGSPSQWANSSGTTNGTFCVTGSASVSGSPGSDATPWSVSIFATGSVGFTGNPKVTANDPSGALVVAEGDVKFAGVASSDQENYEGLIYAGAQCSLSGTPRLLGQLLCKDKADPAGSVNIVNLSDLSGDVSGNPEITFSCGGMLSKRVILSWYQRLGY